MATVTDLSGNLARGAPTTDPNYSTPNRNNAGSPVGSVTPQYVGELVQDTTNRVVWRATGTANTAWVVTNLNTP